MVNAHIVYYIFVNHKKNWIGSIKGQIEDIISSDLLEFSQLHLCLSGTLSLMNLVKNYIDQMLAEAEINTNQIHFSFTEQNQFEYPGIKKMHTLAKSNPEDYFVYIHTKGMSYSKSPSTRTIENTYLTRLILWNKSRILSIFNNNQQINKIGLFPSENGWIWFNFFWVRGS